MTSNAERNPVDFEKALMQHTSMITELLVRAVAMEKLLVSKGLITEAEVMQEVAKAGIEINAAMEEKFREALKQRAEEASKGQE
jgi:hypothetical protein